MDLQNYPVNFSKKERYITDGINQGRRLYPNCALGTEYNSALNNHKILGQPATNYLGVRLIKSPLDDSRQYVKGRPWNPHEYGIPILVPPPVKRQFNPICG